MGPRGRHLPCVSGTHLGLLYGEVSTEQWVPEVHPLACCLASCPRHPHVPAYLPTLPSVLRLPGVGLLHGIHPNS